MGSPLIRLIASAALFALIVLALATGGQGPLSQPDVFVSVVVAVMAASVSRPAPERPPP